MKVAVVHEWLVNYAGSERVLEQILQVYPESDLFSVIDFLPDAERGFVQGKRARTTFIQRVPGARTRYRSLLPLMPLAIEQLDLSGYDLVISSSHAVAKGVLTGPDQLHICYCHSPIRYAWDLQHQYLRESGMDRGLKSWLARPMLHYMRMWDSRTAQGVDEFLANSSFIARRIMKSYRRASTVMYPPVDVSGFAFRPDKEAFYLTASRMVPYKRVPMIVEAFAAMPHLRLVVIGEGTEFQRAQIKAGPNIEFLGYQSFEVMRDHMQRAKAFVFAAEEDFGITPVEAQACGTPVIAFGRGGSLETIDGTWARPASAGVCAVHEGSTGVFYKEQSAPSLIEAVQFFERHASQFQPAACTARAHRFSAERFRAEFQDFVETALRSRTSDAA